MPGPPKPASMVARRPAVDSPDPFHLGSLRRRPDPHMQQRLGSSRRRPDVSTQTTFPDNFPCAPLGPGLSAQKGAGRMPRSLIRRLFTPNLRLNGINRRRSPNPASRCVHLPSASRAPANRDREKKKFHLFGEPIKPRRQKLFTTGGSCKSSSGSPSVRPLPDSAHQQMRFRHGHGGGLSLR